MLEQDYVSLYKHMKVQRNIMASVGSDIVRDIVIPQLTQEVNENKNFAMLRQVYNSLILATWYKNKIKENIFKLVYENKNKIVDGIKELISVGVVKLLFGSYEPDIEVTVTPGDVSCEKRIGLVPMTVTVAVSCQKVFAYKVPDVIAA